MKKLLVMLFLLLPLYVFAGGKENLECNKFYMLKKHGNEYVRMIEKIADYPDEQVFEKMWHIDCKNNKVIFTGGIFEREYTLEKHIYDKKSQVYLINISGEEEGTLVSYTLKIKYIDNDKAYIYGYYNEELKDIYTNMPDEYKIIRK